MKHYIYTFLFLLVSQTVLSQIPATIVKENTYTITAANGDVKLQATQSITLKPNTWIKSGSTFLAQITEEATATDSYTSFSFSNENYVFTRSFQAPMTSFNAATAKESDVTEQITYFDGLGRPMQSIGIKASPNDKKDIITHIDYDDYGRQDKDWLPYHELSGVVGTYRGDKAADTKSYYQTNYANDFAEVTLPADINAYSEKGFEASPLSRVLKQGAPGKDWKLGANNEIEFVYDTNILNEVRLYQVTFTGNNPEAPQLAGGTTFYAANLLYKTITKDENHDGTASKAHSTEEFKDKQGRVILKRTYGTSIVNGVSLTNTAHDTYYVYDDYGNLTYVLPPKSEPNTGLPDVIKLSELCYQYKYDDRNRLVEKKTPGKDWEYIVYNNLDQPVLTQDALQRPNKQWLFTKYDVFGRVVYTGIYTHETVATREQMITALKTYYTTNPSEDLFEEKEDTEGSYHYYSNGAFPNAGLEALTVNYYDNYSFDMATLSLPANHDGQNIVNYDNTSQKLTKGLATGSKVRVLGTTNWITTITGYDVKGRPVYGVSNNSYLGTIDIIKSTLNFAGAVVKTETDHTKGGNNVITEDLFTYDHVGRLKKQTQELDNTNVLEVIVENNYDNLGQLIGKNVGGKTTQGRLQNVEYTYNVRGWLKQINNPTTLGSGLFGFKINYNTVDHSGTKLYNGNIAETEWKTQNDNVLRYYNYSYDALNRITNGTDNLNRYTLSDITYDKNGNLETLKRLGHIVAQPDKNVSSDFGVMDNLTYSYQPNSNKLLIVSDAIITPSLMKGEFKDDFNLATPDLTTDYTYDSNGNMLTDANKGISTNITYNHLNLPTSVTLSGGTISYIYDATGVKLQKKVVENGNPDAYTYYAGNYVYEGSSLKFFNHAEGYVEPKDENNLSLGYNYVYQYKDHLGNVRLSYQDVSTTSTSNLEILEENNYYPFGLKHKGYNTNVGSTNIALKRKFGGKEYQDELGLGWYDITARNYDPAIGRWMNLDPLAEDMTRHSPYNYAFDNPIYYIDPDGMSPFDNYKIYANGSILRQKTNDATDTFTFVDSDGGNHNVGTFAKNDNGLIQTPNIDYESGDVSVKISTKAGNESRSNISGTALSSMIGASADSGQEISVVSVSNADGTSPSPSTSHVDGKNADIRYAGTNNTRNPIDYEDNKTNFDKIDQTASSTMNASLKKFGYKDIRSSTLIAPTKEIQMSDGTKRVNKKSYSVSGTKNLKSHYNHEHLQGYRPNVTTRNYATPVSNLTARGIQL